MAPGPGVIIVGVPTSGATCTDIKEKEKRGGGGKGG